MHWSDDGIILSVRKHGEHSAIVQLLTCAHGRHAGLVRGATGKALRGVLQPGNEVRAAWTGRLEEHLGTLQVELLKSHAASLMEDGLRLAALTSAAALAATVLPEREPHGAVYEGFRALLDALEGVEKSWPAVYVRWELGLLAEMGYGLDLSACAATGAVENLAYVSPRSGRAVSAEAAAPYSDKLLRLPSFLVPGRGGPPANDFNADILGGLELAGFFLERWCLGPHGQKMPPARARLIEKFSAQATRSGV